MINDYQNNPEAKLKQAIMQRVRTVHAVRVIGPRLALKAFGLISAVAACFALISVPDVMSNLGTVSGFGAKMGYLASSLLRAEFAVQAVVLCGFVVVAAATADVIRAFSRRQEVRVA